MDTKMQLRRKRHLTGYKFFMKVCIKELKRRYPESTIILPMVSKMCAKRWISLNESMKRVFQLEAENCERRGFTLDGDDEPPDIDLLPLPPLPQLPLKEPEPTVTNFPMVVNTLASIKEEPEEIEVLDDPGNEPEEEEIKIVNQLAAGSGTRKPKSKSIPGGPKRPLSAFVWYCKFERPRVREGHPGLSMGEISKILGKLWHALEPEKKKEYQQISMEDRERYGHQLAVFKGRQKFEALLKNEMSDPQLNNQPHFDAPVQLMQIKQDPSDDIDEEEFNLWMPQSKEIEEDFLLPPQNVKRVKNIENDETGSLYLKCDEDIDFLSLEEDD